MHMHAIAEEFDPAVEDGFATFHVSHLTASYIVSTLPIMT